MASSTDPATTETPPGAETGGPRRKLSMALINFWLDAALFVSVVALVWISVMMQVVFPPPTAAAGWRLWGLSFDQWRNVQFGALCVAALLAIEHLVLHWNWVCSVIATQVLRVKSRPDEGAQAIYGVGTFIGILIVMLAGIVAATLMVQSPTR